VVRGYRRWATPEDADGERREKAAFFAQKTAFLRQKKAFWG
jgi:hypothetical protein